MIMTTDEQNGETEYRKRPRSHLADLAAILAIGSGLVAGTEIVDVTAFEPIFESKPKRTFIASPKPQHKGKSHKKRNKRK